MTHIYMSGILLSDLILEVIELLQHNLTQVDLELASCKDLQKAAQSFQTAAEKQTQSCHFSRQFLQKQL